MLPDLQVVFQALKMEIFYPSPPITLRYVSDGSPSVFLTRPASHHSHS